MFRTWKVNVKDLLSTDPNKWNNLTVVFKSAVLHDNRQAALEYPFFLPAENTRIYSRKAAYQYGWDWGPRLVTCGIWKPVYLSYHNYARLSSVYFQTQQISNTSASMVANFYVDVSRAGTYTLKVTNSGTGVVLNQTTLALTNKTNNVTVTFSIANPQLWWPRGFGEQYMYNLTGELLLGSNSLDKKSHNVGVRTTRLVQDADPIGRSFYFVVNGKPVFAKGGNYIPPDMFMPRVTYEVYNQTLQAALDANYNFIRVWGGGNYENDTFYDICDRTGILLWQEFMFADGMYPGRAGFLANIEQELIDNIVRIRNHPSIIVWVGNNEISEGWHNWGWKQNLTEENAKVAWQYYVDIFLTLIPKVLNTHDTSRPYWPTSPEFGYGHYQSFQFGDSHYWGVWADAQEISTYLTNVGRFVSEYGMQGMLCVNSLLQFSKPDEWQFNNTVMLVHERHLLGWPLLNQYMTQTYQPISNFINFAYGTQVMQKYALQIAIEAHRRNKPITMGTLTWQLNDVWPVFSWATRDYYGNWKAAHFMAKKFYKDVVVSIAQNQAQPELYNFYVISDKLYDFNATLNMSLITLTGTTVWSQSLNITVPEYTSQVYYTLNVSTVPNFNPNSTVAFGEVFYGFDDGHADNIYYFVLPQNMTLSKPKLQINMNPTANTVTLSTNVFSMGTFIYVNGTNLNLDDNYFDLIPGKPKTVKFLTAPPKNLVLSYMTIYDAYDNQTVVEDCFHEEY